MEEEDKEEKESESDYSSMHPYQDKLNVTDPARAETKKRLGMSQAGIKPNKANSSLFNPNISKTSFKSADARKPELVRD